MAAKKRKKHKGKPDAGKAGDVKGMIDSGIIRNSFFPFL